MSRKLLVFWAVLVVVLGASFTAQADNITFNLPDSYVGGPVVNGAQGQDQIGSEFQLTGFSGNFNTATLMATWVAEGSYFTNYLGHVGYADDYTPGYLFLGATSPPANSSSTVFNVADWKYIVCANGADGIGAGGVYTFDPNSVVLTSAPSGWEYRASQGWKATGLVKVADAFVSISDGQMSWIFSYVTLGLTEDIATYFTMGCGNDVLWSSTPAAPVPNPSTLLLLASGLLGLAGLKRKAWRKTT